MAKCRSFFIALCFTYLYILYLFYLLSYSFHLLFIINLLFLLIILGFWGVLVFWIGVCLGAELINVGISMVVGIFVGGDSGGWVCDGGVAQNLLKGLILWWFWVVGRG